MTTPDERDRAAERLDRVERLAEQQGEAVAERGDRRRGDAGDRRRQALGAVVEEHERRRGDDERRGSGC